MHVHRVVGNTARGQGAQGTGEQPLADALVESCGDDREPGIADTVTGVTPLRTWGATSHGQSGSEVSR
jgi:hypothetical protein